MSTLFISHSSQDAVQTKELAERLRVAGFESLFLDLDPTSGIVAGRSWEQALYRNLRACTAVIVVWTDNYAKSSWCFAEVALARMLGKDIFTLRIDSSDEARLPSILSEKQYIDMAPDAESGYKRLWHGLEQAKIEKGTSENWSPNDPPYPGLESFQTEHATVFFGRAGETRRGLEELASLRRLGNPRMLLVLGPSGSGKSSLVRAGLLPRLRRMENDWVVIGPLRPETKPAAALEDAIADATGMNWRDVRKSLEGEAGLAGLLREAMRDLGKERRAATPLLVIDQLEEALGRSDSNESVTRFQDLVAAALAADDGPLVLATLRSDYLGALQQAPALGKVEFKPLPVGPMSRDDMRVVIAEPARLGRIELEGGLTEKLLDDTGVPDALPLLAFTLREMWNRYRNDGKFTLAEYKQLGGIEGALAKVADSAFETALSLGSEETLRGAFLRLARTADGGSGFARRTVLWKDVEPARPMLECFVKQRLLVSSGDDKTRPATPTKSATLEVAHEALFRSWELLRKWLEDDGADLHHVDRFRTAAADWHEAGRRADFQWSDERAMETRRALNRLGRQPSEVESQFLGPTQRSEMIELLANSDTSHEMRSTIGSRLEILGDDRPGVGLGDDGLPDIAWCSVSGGRVEARFPEEDWAPGDLPEGHEGIEELFEEGQEYTQMVLGYGITLPDFDIARFPVTRRQYEAFARAKDFLEPKWWEGFAAPAAPPTRPSQMPGNEPVTNVDWFHAVAFCRWLSSHTGHEVRLPSIWEWELAARGSDKRRYPWGEVWDERRANTIETGLGRAAAVGMYPAGASPVGALDMCGNVWDWCYYDPPKKDEGGLPAGEAVNRPVRGGSWNHLHTNAQTTNHHNSDAPTQRYFDLGFRLLRP